MSVPQVTERMKELPAAVLRAVFAGIGQLLLAADKLRGRVMEQPAPPPPAAQPRPAPQPGPAPRPGPAETGNVRVIRERADGGGPAAGPAARPAAKPPTRPAAAKPPTRPAAAKPAAKPAAAKPAAKPAAPVAPVPAAEPAPSRAAAAEPPLPNYDDLSVASLRARLRVLDAAKVRALLEYEQAHARREVVVTMFERRLAKMEGAD